MHTSARKGTPVICILKDGSQVRGKFVERKSKYVVIQIEDGHIIWINKKDLRAMPIVRR